MRSSSIASSLSSSFRNLVMQALIVVAILRGWRVANNATVAFLLALLAATLATHGWQARHPASFERWREIPSGLLILGSFGLGLGWVQTRLLLDASSAAAVQGAFVPAPPAPHTPFEAAFTATTAAATQAALLLFASGAAVMAMTSLAFRVRLRCVCA